MNTIICAVLCGLCLIAGCPAGEQETESEQTTEAAIKQQPLNDSEEEQTARKPVVPHGASPADAAKAKGLSPGSVQTDDQASEYSREHIPQDEMAWRPFVDPKMSIEEIRALDSEAARERLDQLKVEFETWRFMESIEMDPVELTALMLKAGMSANEVNHAGISAAQVAAIHNKPKHLNLLLAEAADVLYEDPVFDANLTDFAVQSGNLVILQTVLEAGAPQGGGPESAPLLIDAIESRSLPMIKWVLERYPDPNVVDRMGTPAILTACMQTDLKTVKFLLEAGADMDAEEPRGGNCLAAAVFGAKYDTVDYLLELGADPLEVYRDGRTLLFELCRNVPFNLELGRRFIEMGMDVNAVEEASGTTALIMAARSGNVDAARLLLENGADPAPVDSNGFNAYGYAVNSQYQPMIELLESFSVNEAVMPELEG